MSGRHQLMFVVRSLFLVRDRLKLSRRTSLQSWQFLDVPGLEIDEAAIMAGSSDFRGRFVRDGGEGERLIVLSRMPSAIESRQQHGFGRLQDETLRKWGRIYFP
jgi:hypothetical protein